MIKNDFFYDGHWLSEYNMKMCSPNEVQQFVSRTLEKSEITTLRYTPNHFGTIYNDVLILNFLIVKNTNNKNKQTEYKLSGKEIHMLRSWLESSDFPIELSPLDYSINNTITTNTGAKIITNNGIKIVNSSNNNSINVHYLGVFTEIQPFLVEQECYGLYLTFTCNSPFGYSDVYTRSIDISATSTNVVVNINNESLEIREFVYPSIKIFSNTTFNKSDYIKIQNKTDSNSSITYLLPNGLSEIIIDTDKKVVYDSDGNAISLTKLGISQPSNTKYDFISADRFLVYWPYLISGNNQLMFTLNNNHNISRIEITYRYSIKSGGF